VITTPRRSAAQRKQPVTHARASPRDADAPHEPVLVSVSQPSPVTRTRLTSKIWCTVRFSSLQFAVSIVRGSSSSVERFAWPGELNASLTVEHQASINMAFRRDSDLRLLRDEAAAAAGGGGRGGSASREPAAGVKA